ncbi:MAG: cupin domain-containing protein [Clostridia bacterium]|nr:cupin domain-containing protein [Clostridia bacterium]
MDNNQSYDLGNAPVVINIQKETRLNTYYRKAIWTGNYLQVTVMSIPAGGEIGLEMHPDTDQFIRVEFGVGSVYMGKTKQDVKFVGDANSNYAILVPAGTWHNVINNQRTPLKVYSIYAPPHHPIGIIHKTKFDSDLAND